MLVLALVACLSLPQNLVRKPLMTSINRCQAWDFPGGPVVKNLPSIARGASSIPGQGAKIPHNLRPKKQKQYCSKFNKDLKKKNRCQADPLSWDSPNRKTRYRGAITLPSLQSLATGQFPQVQQLFNPVPCIFFSNKHTGTLLETQSAGWEPWTQSTSY